MSGDGPREAVPGEEGQILEFLERDPLRNLRIVYPLRRYGLLNLGFPEQGLCLVLSKKGEVGGVLFWDNLGLVRWSAPRIEAEALMEAALERWGCPQALAGEEGEVAHLLDRFPELRREVEHVEEEVSMILEPHAFRGPDGGAELARGEDLREWMELEREMQVEILGRAASARVLRREARLLLGEGRAFLVREDGKAVSKAALEAVTPAADELGGVYTRKSHRGRGYALSACGAACASSLSRGKRVRLETQRDNLPAISLYRRLGFVTMWNHLVVRLKGEGPSP